MTFAPGLFYSNIKAKGGLARPSNFQVIIPIPQYISTFIGSSLIEKIINFPNSIFSDVTDAINSIFDGDNHQENQSRSYNSQFTRYLALQCTNAELVGKTFHTAEHSTYGPTFKVPYQTMYPGTSFSFICSNEFSERKLFERWMEAIQPNDTWNMRFPKGDNTRYMTDIKIIQYDDFFRQIYAVELIDAFPIGIASQGLDWRDGNGFHQLSIQMEYHTYRPIYQGTYDIGESLSSILGQIFQRGTSGLFNIL